MSNPLKRIKVSEHLTVVVWKDWPGGNIPFGEVWFDKGAWDKLVDIMNESVPVDIDVVTKAIASVPGMPSWWGGGEFRDAAAMVLQMLPEDHPRITGYHQGMAMYQKGGVAVMYSPSATQNGYGGSNTVHDAPTAPFFGARVRYDDSLGVVRNLHFKGRTEEMTAIDISWLADNPRDDTPMSYFLSSPPSRVSAEACKRMRFDHFPPGSSVLKDLVIEERRCAVNDALRRAQVALTKKNLKEGVEVYQWPQITAEPLISLSDARRVVEEGIQNV